MARRRRADAVARAVKDLGTYVRRFEPKDGWPARLDLSVSNQVRRYHVYAGGQIDSFARKPHEFRFQNPGQDRPIRIRAGVGVLLLAATEWKGTSLLVLADPERRANRNTRFSVLFPRSILDQAATTGWAEYRSSSDELIVAIKSQLLPVYVAAQSTLSEFSEESMTTVIGASGAGHLPDEPAVERARVATERLSRSALFARKVKRAYDDKCAVCDLNWGLVQGAHIYPVSAPGSPDEVWNGIALCPNHHALFDRYLLYINPGSFAVRVHPDKTTFPGTTERFLIESLHPRLVLPRNVADHPRKGMLVKRYSHYASGYDWV